ncbi:TRAP transporter small permease [Sulfitobacter mediterraneus]|jgi:C4-dicarboxylate transporter, DctQ subunit|uniref:TRAP transporter small permease n=1 Tax=Sulfitobacter TaxID=60136 RepID=UPI0019336123|nr:MULTISPECIES: TRAP transporter small permease [Sulfitobacter]MBM1631839.1 TRAP transporter small permease [Sulfitobacter mediterraneus]MBM1639654.1 TRAP transporter small permease [Sulfitobacter mediterraneus]MBM1643703.1 TRAP transporter small permease [Sulfitobacter mediterraneus]MBM1647749.1 TRAP transporter small permease [Sulfitobacter mediterraneus]MBM1651794.1 TRAP transporter small permease [Sulfitobacter mediterraneus]
MATHGQAQSGLGRIVSEIEETAIALILGLMTIITFINVVLRYGFNTGIIWGLEAVTFLFAWLVLFGMSYAVKVTAHLGVDAVINLFNEGPRKVLAVIAGLICVIYAGLLMKGAWDYWAPFAGLDATSGRWFPTGFENSRDQAWYEVIDIPVPEWLRFIEPIMNEGEAYEKLPRFIPYFMLPFGAALLLLRFVQATLKVITGRQTSLIVSHEAEDAVEDVKHMNAEG